MHSSFGSFWFQPWLSSEFSAQLLVWRGRSSEPCARNLPTRKKPTCALLAWKSRRQRLINSMASSIKLLSPSKSGGAMIKILLVEDDEHCQLVTLRRLNAISGFKADAVSTLKDAIEKFSSCEYDVVVLDLSLRDSHSSRTVAAMKGQHPNCAIVVLSGYEDP